MIFNLAIAVVLLFLSSSNALILDSSVHLARHQQIAARHPAVKRSPASARCKAPQVADTSSTVKSPKPSSASASASPKSISASPKSTSAPASSSPKVITSSSSGSSKKAGLGWFESTDAPNFANFITPSVSAVYTWSVYSPTDRHNLQFCPMLWGSAQVEEFQSVVKKGYADCVMGFNEPNLPSQSNLSPQDAADLWMQNIEPLRQQGYSTFVTPAVASSSNAISWYQDFFKACVKCQFDIMALHYYSTQSADMITYITSLHKTFNMDIWMTEYACMDFAGGPQASNEDQVIEFMSNVTTWMENTDYIKKFFPYGLGTADEVNINRLDALIGSDGQPNALGCLSLGGC